MAATAQILEPLMTPQEVADLLKVSVSTVYRLLRTRELPGRRVGAQWRWNPEVVRAYLRGEPSPGGPAPVVPITSGRRRV